MYLAKTFIHNRYRYILRESVKRDGTYFHRDLFDLGENPARFIIYPGGNAYYIDEAIEDRLNDLGIPSREEELDSLFWPYVKPSIQRAVGAFRDRGHRQHRSKRLSPTEKKKIHLQTHIFDKRRVHFLKTGRADQRGLGRMPAEMLSWLQNKSRDEIEQGFIHQELVLRSHELKTYIYVIFNLKRFFSTVLAERAPELLDVEALDAHFIDEICRLNLSNEFWGDPDHGDWLHDYLVRYLIIFFDNEFANAQLLHEEIQAFINRHRAYRPPPENKKVSLSEASALFDTPKDILEKMPLSALTRLYRRLALEHHPDRGGDPETFIRIAEAYQSIARTKKVR